MVELVNTKVANLTSYTTCDWEELQIPYACSQVGKSGWACGVGWGRGFGTGAQVC